jgi:3-oxoadipate enol-lactonase
MFKIMVINLLLNLLNNSGCHEKGSLMILFIFAGETNKKARMACEYMISHNGSNIFVTTEGAGEPILLLHSYWGSSELFDSLTTKLSVNYKVIRLDFPGHGRSSSPERVYTFEEFAATIDHVLHQLGIEEPLTIIGHSMGGYASMAFAKRYPERIKAIILMHSPLCNADNHSIILREREAGFLRKGKKELLLRTILETNFAPGNENIFLDEFEKLNRISRKVTIDGALAAIHAINTREDSRQLINTIDIPILVIIGKFDRVYNPDEMMNELSGVPAVKTIILSKSGHLGFIEEEKAVFTALIAFLKSNIPF